MTLKFNRVLEVVKVHVHAKFHQAKCSGSWVINSALDFGQRWTLIVNISGTDQAIDKRKTASWSATFSTFTENNLVNCRPLTKNGFDSDHEIALTNFFALSRNGKVSANLVLWPWLLTHDLEILRVSCLCQDTFRQNFIKLSAAVHELSC